MSNQTNNQKQTSLWISERHLNQPLFLNALALKIGKISHILVPDDLSQDNRELIIRTFNTTDLRLILPSEIEEDDYRIKIVC